MIAAFTVHTAATVGTAGWLLRPLAAAAVAAVPEIVAPCVPRLAPVVGSVGWRPAQGWVKGAAHALAKLAPPSLTLQCKD